VCRSSPSEKRSFDVMSRHLFSDWDKVSRRLRSGPVLWLFDFDGTLAPIVRKPEGARLAPEVRRFLAALARRAGFRVGIISGRSLRELRRKVALPGLILSGNHGLEMSGLGVRFVHPQARAQAAALRKLLGMLRQGLRQFPGILVEWKGFSISVHYRLLAASRAALFKRTFHELVCRASRGFIMRPGKKVFDILPATNWNKGSAVRRIKENFKPRTTLYVGDDLTDKDAFRALGPRDVSVRVGEDSTSGALYHLKNVGEIRKLLREAVSL
jgi:trehalose 6-phosphate phosphatase